MEGGTAHGYDNCCSFGVPRAPVYKGGGRRPATKGARHGGSPTRTPLLVGFGPPLFPFSSEGKREGEGEGECKRKGGWAPSPLSNSGSLRGCATLGGSPLSPL